jgi:hypothetical protein
MVSSEIQFGRYSVYFSNQINEMNALLRRQCKLKINMDYNEVWLNQGTLNAKISPLAPALRHCVIIVQSIKEDPTKIPHAK